MANFYSNFGKKPEGSNTRLAGLSGTVKAVADDLVIVNVTLPKYTPGPNGTRGTYSDDIRTYTVDMSEIGGTDGISKGMPFTAIGMIEGTQMTAKAADCGTCRVRYGEYGIVAGEATYQKKETRSGKTYMDAKFRTQNDNGEYVYDHVQLFSSSNWDQKSHKWIHDNEFPNKVEKNLIGACNREKLEQKSYANAVYEGYPFQSAFGIQVVDDKPGGQYSKTAQEKDIPSDYKIPDGNNADTVVHIRRQFALNPKLTNVGGLDMSAIKEREAASKQYNNSKEQNAPAQEEVKTAETQGFTNADETPFDMNTPDYSIDD